jgi:hypothetical protein
MRANAAQLRSPGRDALGSGGRAASQPKGFTGGKYSNRIARGSVGKTSKGIRRDRKGRFA